MRAAPKLLDCLSRVKQTGPDRWIASCPTGAHAHGDRSRGLSIRAVDDRVLIYCHAGCGAVDVVEALGLTLTDLYDWPGEHRVGSTHSRIPARDLLEIISEETSVVAIVAADLLGKRSITEADWQRVAQAAARIGAARDHVYGG
jgi:hypothetical protein